MTLKYIFVLYFNDGCPDDTHDIGYFSSKQEAEVARKKYLKEWKISEPTHMYYKIDKVQMNKVIV